MELCGTIKMNGGDHDVIKLKLFPFSLRDKARSWFHNLMSGSINRWGGGGGGGGASGSLFDKKFPPNSRHNSELKSHSLDKVIGRRYMLLGTYFENC